MATKEELVKTNDRLHKELTSARARYDKLDPEARAFHFCVKALDELKAKSSGYGQTEYSLGRVVDALRARFNLGNQDVTGEMEDAPYYAPEDPRDVIITQMIDAIRRG